MCDMDERNEYEGKLRELLDRIKEQNKKIEEYEGIISSKNEKIEQLNNKQKNCCDFFIEGMKKAYKKNKKCDSDLYLICKEKCENYEIEELLYVKAALELKKKSNAYYSGIASSMTALISNIIMVLTMWYGILGNSGILGQAIFFGVCYIVLNGIIIGLNIVKNRSYKKYIFFYSIVCDVIEEKIRKEK